MSNQQHKEQQLRWHKARATGLFVLMALVFIISSIYQGAESPVWLDYVRAFSEAAMVGALADWYAVTALFHHPLGLKIPHTNIIRRKKKQIGDNLGEFIVDKFLSDENVRPYIENLQPSQMLANWLAKPSTQTLIAQESVKLILDTLNQMDDREVVAFIKKHLEETSQNIEVHKLAVSGIDFVLDKQWHQLLITAISKEIRNYIVYNHRNIYDFVQEKSYKLIPEIVDRKIAKEITLTLLSYLLEMENDPKHPIYKTIPEKLSELKEQILNNPEWQEKLNSIKKTFIKDERLEHIAYDIWYAIKQSATATLDNDEHESVINKYIRRHLIKLSENLQQDTELQQRLDLWIHKSAYRQFRRHRHLIAQFISSTVGNWEADRLNKTLELEVGKDLQYIRINGTVIGGLVGLVIHFIGTLL